MLPLFKSLSPDQKLCTQIEYIQTVCQETVVVPGMGKIEFSEGVELTYDSKYKSED
jgi:hypothetical protein